MLFSRCLCDPFLSLPPPGEALPFPCSAKLCLCYAFVSLPLPDKALLHHCLSFCAYPLLGEAVPLLCMKLHCHLTSQLIYAPALLCDKILCPSKALPIYAIAYHVFATSVPGFAMPLRITSGHCIAFTVLLYSMPSQSFAIPPHSFVSMPPLNATMLCLRFLRLASPLLCFVWLILSLASSWFAHSTDNITLPLPRIAMIGHRFTVLCHSVAAYHVAVLVQLCPVEPTKASISPLSDPLEPSIIQPLTDSLLMVIG